MKIHIQFFSYYRDLTGVARLTESLPPGSSVGEVMNRVQERFPKLAVLDRSTLIAVGVEYAAREQVLKDGDEVSLFPPVQGG